MQTHIFLVRALTNLHVGSGDSNFGIVDKLVQRDAATKLPTIHSSSIKGALREHLEEVLGWGKEDPRIAHVFGSQVGGDSAKAQQGSYHFFSADLLALAVPDENESSANTFFRSSSEPVRLDFAQKAIALNGFRQAADLVLGMKGNNADFKEEPTAFKAKAENLPVIARNQLENGISKNLWYEEIVPRESVFGWVVQTDGDRIGKGELEKEHFIKLETAFLDALKGKIIQIGANATVGYGFCHFTKIN